MPHLGIGHCIYRQHIFSATIRAGVQLESVEIVVLSAKWHGNIDRLRLSLLLSKIETMPFLLKSRVLVKSAIVPGRCFFTLTTLSSF